MTLLFNELDKIFKDMNIAMSEEFNKNPIFINVSENEEEYEVNALIPGVKKENLEVGILDGVLTIKVNNSEEKKEYLVNEINTNYKERKIKLKNINADSIKAKLEDGILTLNIGKITETKTKYIEIL